MRVAKLAIDQGMEVRPCTSHKCDQKSDWQEVFCGGFFFSLEVCLVSQSVAFQNPFGHNFFLRLNIILFCLYLLIFNSGD